MGVVRDDLAPAPIARDLCDALSLAAEGSAAGAGPLGYHAAGAYREVPARRRRPAAIAGAHAHLFVESEAYVDTSRELRLQHALHRPVGEVGPTDVEDAAY